MFQRLRAISLTASFLLLGFGTTYAQLSGTYTIDPSGSGTSNYTTITSAISALTTSGVNGATVFNIKQGTYTEQLTFSAITGTSNANGVTFQSDPTNTSSPVITFAPTSSSTTANYTVTFNAVSHVTLDGLNITSSGTSYGRVLTFSGASSNITLSNNTIDGTGTSTFSSYAVMYATATPDTLHITDNTFTGGSYLTYFTGSSSSMAEDFKFNNNTATGFQSYGVRAYYVASGEVIGNTLTQATTSTSSFYGVYIRNIVSGTTTPGTWLIHDNHLTGGRGYGLYLNYMGGSSTSPTKVYNNMVHFNGGTTSSSYGAYLYHPVNVEFYNNTTRNNGTSNSNQGIYTSANTSTSYPTPSATIKNNIFVNDVAGYPAYFYVSSAFTTSYLTLGNNIYYTPAAGNQGFYYGTAALSSFAAYQAASGDTTSYASDPIFLGASDLHVEGLLADGNASVVSYITSDIDGDTRSSTTPDIGADEFVPPLCATPSTLTFGGISATSASVSWMGASSAYELEWGLTGFTQGTGSTTSATTTSATLPGLFSSSTYDLYVRSNCVSSGNGYSGWYGPVSFTTPCLPYAVTSTTGFIENFDGSNWTANVSYQNDVFDNCWDRTPTVYSSFAFLVNSGGTPSSSTGPLAANSGSNYLYTESSFGTVGSPALVKLQTLDLSATTNPELSFYYHMYGATITGLWVDVSTDNGATFTAIDSLVGSQQTSQSASWTQHKTNLAAYAGDTIVISLRTQKGASFTGDLSIDNVSVQNVLCSGPSFLTSSGVNASGATINWVVPDTANPTVISWGPAGFTPGTGSTVTTYDSTYTLNTLASATCYDVYVQSMCGTNGSLWVGPVSFCTPCTAAAIPYTEDFQSWNSSLPTPLQCWDIDKGTNTALLYTDPTTSNNMVRYNYWSWQSGLTGIIESRPIAISSAATVSFDWSHSNQYYTSYNDALALRVRKSTSPNWDTLVYLNGQSFGSTGAAISTPGLFVTESVYLDTSYVGHDAIFEFYGASGWGPDVFIDNFAVDLIPTCPDPVLTSTGQTDSSVTLAWTTVGTTALGSTITWGPQGFYQGTTATGINIYGVTSPYTITGLNPNTFYDFYVTDSCGATDFSGLVGPVTAKTECLTTLSGAYTVDTAGTGANNFTTLDSAVQYLVGCGVSGPVTFTLAANQTWTTGISLTSVIGASSTNTVTFQGQAGSKVMAALGMSEAVLFDGTKYVTLKDMIIDGNGFTGIRLTNNAQYINIEDNLIVADTVGTTSSVTAITATSSMTSGTGYGNNANHITISGNEIKGGYYGIVMSGSSSTSRISDINILNNDLTLQYFYGIRCYYVEDVDIIGNSFTDARASGSYGIYASYVFDFNIEENNLVAKTYALYLSYGNYQVNGLSTQSRVVNNMCSSAGLYGMYANTPRFVDFYNNTFKGSTYGAYLYSTTSTTLKSKMWDVRNNIFVGGSNYAVYVPNVPDSTIGWDYNLYNTGGANIARWGTTTHATLAAWQAADTAYNQNSTDAAVLFTSSDDLHILNTAPNDLAEVITSVTVDVDGDSRSATTPDIGADEYTPIAFDAKTAALLGVSGGCGDSLTELLVVFENFGISAITSMPVTVEVTDPQGVVTSLQQTYTGNLASSNTDTLVVGTLNTYVGGVYDFKAYTQLTNDGRANNDTLVKLASSFIPVEPIVSGVIDTVCASVDSVMLYATGYPGTMYGWYDSLSGGSQLVTGDSMNVATSGQTSFWVQFLSNADSLETTFAAGNGQNGNMFDINVKNPVAITGFTMNVTASGTAEIYYRSGSYVGYESSATGWTVVATNVTVASTGAVLVSLPTSLSLGSGIHAFYVTMSSGSVAYTNGTSIGSVFASNNDLDFYQGVGKSYPFGSTFSPRVWNGRIHYGSVGCSNIRKEVGFAVNSDTALAVGSGTETVPASGTYDFDATGSYGQTYDWTYGDGNVGSGLMVQHSYPTAGVYTVSLVVMDTVCGSSDSVSFQVTSHVGLDENVLGQLIQAYPNPSNGQLMITIDGMNDFEGLLQVVNGVGQVLVQETVAKQSGLVSIPMDLRDLAKGVYTIRLAGEAGENNLRVVLQ